MYEAHISKLTHELIFVCVALEVIEKAKGYYIYEKRAKGEVLFH